jgi:hypothetical protein
MKDILDFFTVISLEGLTTICSKQRKVSIQNQLDDVHTSCFNSDTLNAQCLYEKVIQYIQEKSSTTELFIREITPFKDFRTNKERTPELISKDGRFKEYLLSEEQITEGSIEDILKHIKNSQYLAAAELIAKIKGSDSAKKYALEIRKIYGSDKIKIWNSITQRWE